MRRLARPDATLVIYIEGDGAAWPSPYRPPGDPTPETPHALLLAGRDMAASVAYLARPCQYPEDRRAQECDSRHWTTGRYSQEVIAALNAAIDTLKDRSGARHLALVGYSGGGVIATLLAGRRQDVRELITVAAPLALSEWAARMALSPLAGSVDPLAQPPLPETVAVTHFVGEQDDVVPPAVIERFVAARGGRMVAVRGFSHDCCWLRDWPDLLAWVRNKEPKR
jgi:pimeloyl-ACP methyl ester carboxylesterase